MKFFNYVFLIVGILIIFNAAGYTTPSAGLVGTMVLNDTCKEPPCSKLSNIESSSTYIKIIGIIGAIGVGGAVILGTFFSFPPIAYLIAPFLVFFLGLMMVDLIWLYTKMIEHGSPWMITIVTVIFAPLVIGLIITAIEWWQGRD